MSCETCKEIPGVQIPYVVHEGAMARAERTIKRLWIALIVTILLMFATNYLWMWNMSQYDYSDVTTTTTETDTSIDAEQDGGGVNIIGGGNIEYGAASEDNG